MVFLLCIVSSSPGRKTPNKAVEIACVPEIICGRTSPASAPNTSAYTFF